MHFFSVFSRYTSLTHKRDIRCRTANNSTNRDLEIILQWEYVNLLSFNSKITQKILLSTKNRFITCTLIIRRSRLEISQLSGLCSPDDLTWLKHKFNITKIASQRLYLMTSQLKDTSSLSLMIILGSAHPLSLCTDEFYCMHKESQVSSYLTCIKNYWTVKVPRGWIIEIGPLQLELTHLTHI